MDYKSSGVDIERAEQIKKRIREIAERTRKNFVIYGVGPFGAVLRSPKGYLVATCDGVGTKIILAKEYKKIEVLGYDLVAMNVNDILAMHGKPLFFLDYIGVSDLDSVDIEKIINSISEACEESECSLVGGETAQMPDFYKNSNFELVGFCVGFVKKIPKKESISKGDVILAFPSNGPHSNGFSLIRKLIETGKINPSDNLNGEKVIEILLRPTKIYVKDFFSIVKTFGFPKSSANITGGGIPGNISRILPENISAFIDKKSVMMLSEKFCNSIFSYIGQFVPEEEMFRVFNMGVGFVMIYPRKKAEKIVEKMGDKVFQIGYIGERKNSQVIIE